MKSLVIAVLCLVSLQSMAYCNYTDYACRQAEATEAAAQAQIAANIGPKYTGNYGSR